jgi:hypothetical protein
MVKLLPTNHTEDGTKPTQERMGTLRFLLVLYSHFSRPTELNSFGAGQLTERARERSQLIKHARCCPGASSSLLILTTANNNNVA